MTAKESWHAPGQPWAGRWLSVVARLAFLSAALAGCKERGLDVAELKARTASLAAVEARAMLRAALVKENERQSVLLSAVRNSKREIIRSAGGASLAWADGPQFHYWFGGRFEQLSLPQSPKSFGLSPGGVFAAIVFSNGSQCVVRRLDLDGKKLLHDTTPSDCRGRAAISDDGRSLYVVRGSALHRPPSLENDAIVLDERSRLAGPFSMPYRRVAAGLYAYALGPDRILVFVGAGGYYEAHLISRDGARSLGRGFAAPSLFDALGMALAPLFEKDRTIRPTTVRTIGNLLRGGSGQLQLVPLVRLDGRIELGAATPIPYSASYASISGSGILLVAGERAAIYPRANQNRDLPIPLKRFRWFTEGMVYEDSLGRLRLRRTPATEAEYQVDALLRSIADRGGPPKLAP